MIMKFTRNKQQQTTTYNNDNKTFGNGQRRSSREAPSLDELVCDRLCGPRGTETEAPIARAHRERPPCTQEPLFFKVEANFFNEICYIEKYICILCIL